MLAGLVALGGCASTKSTSRAQAGEVYENKIVTLQLPAGFRPLADVSELMWESVSEQARARFGKGGIVAAMYYKPDSRGAGNTVLSVTAVNLGEKVRALPREEQARLSKYMLARTMRRMAKRKEAFKGQPSSGVVIDGVQAYKAEYTAVALGVRQRGSVYMAISGPRLLHMSAKQRVEASRQDLAAAVASLESLKFKR